MYFVNPLSAFVIIPVSDCVDMLTFFTKEFVLTDFGEHFPLMNLDPVGLTFPQKGDIPAWPGTRGSGQGNLYALYQGWVGRSFFQRGGAKKRVNQLIQKFDKSA